MKFSDRLKNPMVLTLVIPFVAMIAMIGMNAHNTGAYTEYRFKIEGYDPRDILRGHFLTFRYVWPEGSENPSSCTSAVTGCCVFISGHGQTPEVKFRSCGKAGSGGMPVSGTNRQPDQALRQYYIPEEDAPDLESRLRHTKNLFEVGLVVRPDGGAQLKMLYIDGLPLPDFLDIPPPPEAVPERVSP